VEDIVIYHCVVLLTGLLTISSTVFFIFFYLKYPQQCFLFSPLRCLAHWFTYNICVHIYNICVHIGCILCVSHNICVHIGYISCVSHNICVHVGYILCVSPIKTYYVSLYHVSPLSRVHWIYIMCLSYQDLLCVPILCVSPIKSTLDIYYVSLLSRPGCRPWQVPNNTVFLFFPPFFSSFFFLCQSPVHAL